jgi:hypothetical protein
MSVIMPHRERLPNNIEMPQLLDVASDSAETPKAFTTPMAA